MIIKAPRYYDRAIEYPWALENVNLNQGNFLDVGSTVGQMFRKNLSKEVTVYTLNTGEDNRFVGNTDIIRVIGDIRNTEFKNNFFDVITCISTLEHIGVSGRYGVDFDEFGDKRAMEEMFRILKSKGRLLITVPYGLKDVLPLNKLYNKKRLENLFKEFHIIKKQYMKYDSDFYIWKSVDEDVAASTDWERERWYALGMFILEKP